MEQSQWQLLPGDHSIGQTASSKLPEMEILDPDCGCRGRELQAQCSLGFCLGLGTDIYLLPNQTEVSGRACPDKAKPRPNPIVTFPPKKKPAQGFSVSVPSRRLKSNALALGPSRLNLYSSLPSVPHSHILHKQRHKKVHPSHSPCESIKNGHRISSFHLSLLTSLPKTLNFTPTQNIIQDAFILCYPRHGRLGHLGSVCQDIQGLSRHDHRPQLC